ncbi:long chain acyl-CoA synthetase 8-like [Homarus americanus]|nr:long chain acyl-CoA synthetase 8-like [Homarus americanus]XP_042225673.1 long chain acyl-CoA synthetase 8-like [Homarus americanus]
MGVEKGGVLNDDGYWIKGDGGHKHGFTLLEDLKKVNAITVPAILEYAANSHGEAPCMGTRKLKARLRILENGKKLEKLHFLDYVYLSYKEVQEMVVKFSDGIRNLGMSSGDRIAMFAETRAEWYVAAVGCLRSSLSVVTLYTNLPNESIVQSLKETEVNTLITSYDLLPRVIKLIQECALITRVIVIEDQLDGIGSVQDVPEQVTILPFQEVLKLEASMPLVSPKADDIAIIMYTSGSTSHPKGVELTHANIFSSITAYCVQADLRLGDRYLAYLPLAHVMELATETALMAMNVTIAYSSPFTLTNSSAKIFKGTSGDARVARPTCMSAVPLILERIIKGVYRVIEDQGHLKAKIFSEALKYKQRKVGPSLAVKVLDALVFKRVKEELGGELRMLVVGGAPVSPEIQNKIRALFGCTVQVGYGATETAACISSMDTDDIRTGHCGPPNYGVLLSLRDWEEGGYLTTDKPNSRGEIVVGGPMVSRGYFRNSEKTEEVFFEKDGVRWFKTGDIGEVDETGILHVIDRKVDLLKLNNGEYVSLGNIESKLKTHSLIESICVCAYSGAKHVVAIIVPFSDSLIKIGVKLGHMEDATMQDLCSDMKVKKAVLDELLAHGKKQGLGRWDLPAAIFLTPEPWTPESGLVTAALKIKRAPIKARFQLEIDNMYGQFDDPAQ